MSGTRPRPPLFRALGAAEPPPEVMIGDRAHTLVEVLKHDSWAATAIYADKAGRRAIAKFNRTQPALGLGMQWLGRRLASRESRSLERLRGLPNVPEPCGAIRLEGRILWNAAARRFIPGHPLGSNERVNDEFFPALSGLLREMHRRGIAYVDLHKRENILVGDDGRPYLIDFQIGFDVTHPRVRWIPGIGALFGILCRSDEYHLAKHAARHRPDQLGAWQDAARPWWINAHRTVAVPFRELRRRLLVAAGIRSGAGRVQTECAPEDAVRRERDALRPAA
ncbi:MAG: hypothetical protein U0791_00845 [Gemmataceae bacterium]